MDILMSMQASTASNIEVPVSEDMMSGRLNGMQCVGRLPIEAANDCR
jgi:hypothetical protein